MRWMDNMEKWTKMLFQKLLKETEDRWRWRRLVHEATNLRNKDSSTQDKTMLMFVYHACIRTFI